MFTLLTCGAGIALLRVDESKVVSRAIGSGLVGFAVYQALREVAP